MKGAFKILLVVSVLACTIGPAHARFTYAIAGGKVTITGYSGPGGEVVIPGTIEGMPVTAIGDRAFFEQSKITGITIPDSMTRIGEFAFQFCLRLTNVLIGTGVTSIGASAFQFCVGLRSIALPAA